MANASGLVETAAGIDKPEERRVSGTAIAQVIKNCDQTHQGRVQIRLAWLPGVDPWARVATMDSGAYFMPQEGEEVLVAFNRGDVNQPYIIGRLWNDQNQPPRRGDSDPKNTRVIHTPSGHEISFDETEKTVVIMNAAGHRITLKSDSVEITLKENNQGRINFDTAGNITLKAKTSITLDAPTINVNGDNIAISGSQSVRVDGGGYSSIQAAKIDIG